MSSWPGTGALATNSIGINRFMNTQAGEGVMSPNADRSVWKVAVQNAGNPGTALVTNGVITSFTGTGGRGGSSAGNPCPGGGGMIAPTVQYTCSGGNVRIGYGAPPPDAGVSVDSGTDSSSPIDSGVEDGSVEDSGIDTGVEDSGVVDSGNEDSGVADSGVTDSGVVDSGVADSGAPPVDAGPHAIPTFIQGAGFEYSKSVPSATYGRDFGANVHAGNLLVVAYYWQRNGGGSTVSITDTMGSTYARAFIAARNPAQAVELWYAIAPSSGPDTVTVTLSKSLANPVRGILLEYSGVSMLVGSQTQNIGPSSAASLASFNSGAITTSTDHHLLIVAGQVDIPNVKINAPFKGKQTGGSDGLAVISDLADVSAGTYSATFSLNPADAFPQQYVAITGIADFY